MPPDMTPSPRPIIEPRGLRREDALVKVLTQVDAFAKGAQRAADAGDMAAFVELISTAAGLVQIAKALEPLQREDAAR